MKRKETRATTTTAKIKSHKQKKPQTNTQINTQDTTNNQQPRTTNN